MQEATPVAAVFLLAGLLEGRHSDGQGLVAGPVGGRYSQLERRGFRNSTNPMLSFKEIFRK